MKQFPKVKSKPYRGQGREQARIKSPELLKKTADAIKKAIDVSKIKSGSVTKSGGAAIAATLTRRARVWQMYAGEGKNQMEIAIALNVNQSHISRDITAARASLRTDMRGNYEIWFAKELAICDHEESLACERRETALEAWKRSQGLYTTTVRKGAPDSKSKKLDVEEVTEKEENLNGDPRFLRAAEDASQRIGYWHERRCKLLGLDAPLKVQHAVFAVETMTDADLERVVRETNMELTAGLLPATIDIPAVKVNGSGNGSH